MNIIYSFKNLSPAEKNVCQNYFERKIERVSKIVNRFLKGANLDFRAEKFVKKSAYNVALKLFGIRGANFFVSEDDHTLNEAIDLAVDKLVSELRKAEQFQKDRIRKISKE